MGSTKNCACLSVKMTTLTLMTLVLVVTQFSAVTSSSPSVLNLCRARCREEEEMKAACSERRNCANLLPNLNAFVDCLEPCTNLGNNCFQRCAFKTDRIHTICSRQCQVVDSARGGAMAAPGDISGSGARVSSGQASGEGVLCYKTCYDSLLNAAMNRLYTKRI